jgi:homocysteine S-methyltransferase
MSRDTQAITSILAPFLVDPEEVIILDGALATELEGRGADINDPLWSAKVLMEAPESIRQLHYDYFAAGADVAITASYQASFEGFGARGLSREDAAALMRLSVELANQARDEVLDSGQRDTHRPRPLVAASIGPYGAHLHDGSEYHGNYPAADKAISDFHLRRMETLLQANPDLLALETIPSLREGELLLRAMEEFPDTVAWLSFSCQDDTRLCHGESFASAMAAANDSSQIVAVGLNCTAPQHVSPLLASAKGYTTKPLLVYPNSGECWVSKGNRWIPGSTSESLAVMAQLWQQEGARLIGGCCRTGVKDIADLARSMRG